MADTAAHVVSRIGDTRTVTPFQEFRFWARRAPVGERVFAGVAAALAIALLAWLLIPGTADEPDEFLSAGPSDAATSEQVLDDQAPDPEGQESGGSVAADGSAGTSDPSVGGGDGPTSSTDGGGDAAAPAPGAAPADGSPAGCTSPPGGARGVSDSEIKVAITLVQVAGPAANSLFGVPSVENQRANWDAIVQGTNKEGGIACRKLVPKYFVGNPADRNNLVKTCLDIAAAGVYVNLDTGAYAAFPEKNCFAQQRIPYFGGYFLRAKEASQFYPYLFNLNMLDTLYRHTAVGLRDQGFFDPAKGFKKLGFLYQSCNPELVEKMRSYLGEVGVSGARLVGYDLGCPNPFASPSDLQQAVLKFQQNGVSHLTFINAVGDFTNFTNIAEQQRFRPKYGVPDEALISISYGNQRPNANNIDGAVAVTASRDGEERTPGFQPSAGTLRCDAILKAGGRPATYDQETAAGNSCSQMWMFKAAIENAPSMEPTALVAGLQRAKSVEFSYPQGPNDFSGDRVTTGGQFWRTAVFSKGCACWRVPDPNFRRS